MVCMVNVSIGLLVFVCISIVSMRTHYTRFLFYLTTIFDALCRRKGQSVDYTTLMR
jgi:hypothetical protein